jgi:fatty acid desaturase
MTALPIRLIPGAELKRLSAPSDRRGAVRLALHLFMLLAAGILVFLSPPLLLPLAMLIFGLVQVALFAPVHETMHLTAFASRRANRIVGWLAACPSLLNWHYYSAFHLAHHRHTQDPAQDPELTPPAPETLGAYLLRVSGVNYWRARFKVIVDAWRGDMSAYPYIAAKDRKTVIASIRWMSVFVAALATGSGAAFGWWVPFVFWIGPQLLAQPFLRLYLLTEHTGCTEDANGLTNTRTTLTNPVVRLLMWNMGFHAEHHLFPSIPFHRLAEAHARLRDRLTVIQPGYAPWHVAYLKGFIARA